MGLANSKYEPLADEEITVALAPFGVSVAPVLCDRIRSYLRVLLQWTDKISLTAIKEPGEILARHFGESMFAANAAFLAEVVRELKVTDVAVIRSRFVNAPILPLSTDFVTSRALDPAGGLLPWAHRSLAPGGRLVLWTTVEAAKEIAADEHWSWCPPLPIPQSKQRILLVGQPV
jgi:16S rRNA G527 N7-methylase RsmG